MLGLASSVRIYLSTEACDMRRGPDGLCAAVEREFSESAYSGALFAFCRAAETVRRFCGSRTADSSSTTNAWNVGVFVGRSPTPMGA